MTTAGKGRLRCSPPLEASVCCDVLALHSSPVYIAGNDSVQFSVPLNMFHLTYTLQSLSRQSTALELTNTPVQRTLDIRCFITDVT